MLTVPKVPAVLFKGHYASSNVVVGQKLEAYDRTSTTLICVASIKEIDAQGQLLITFDGWTSKYVVASPTLGPLHGDGGGEAQIFFLY